MANSATVTVEFLKEAIHQIVLDNMDENEQALLENVNKAADAAATELQSTSARRGAWRGPSSISKQFGAYRSGWKAYPASDAKAKKFAKVVANAHMPTLTHLLERGHMLVFFGNPTGRRVSGDYVIEAAYNHNAPLLKGGKVT